MPYATKEMIASEAKIGTQFSTSTLPTADKVDEIISEVEAYIDAKIGRVYVLPLVGDGATPSPGGPSIYIVRAISIALCVERVRGIIDSNAPAVEKENPELKDARAFGRTARKQLEEITDGSLPLPGEVLLGAGTGDGVRSYAVSNGYEPVFKRGKVQW